VDAAEWDIFVVHEVRQWISGLDRETHARVVAAIDLLAEVGPGLGRPLVDTIQGSAIPNLKELRPGSADSVRVRSVAVVDSARGGRQGRPVEDLVQRGHPAGGTPL
jgi:hypothetical protein